MAFVIVLALGIPEALVANLQYSAKDAYRMITSACRHGHWLYRGAIDQASIARGPLRPALAGSAAQHMP